MDSVGPRVGGEGGEGRLRRDTERAHTHSYTRARVCARWSHGGGLCCLGRCCPGPRCGGVCFGDVSPTSTYGNRPGPGALSGRRGPGDTHEEDRAILMDSKARTGLLRSMQREDSPLRLCRHPTAAPCAYSPPGQSARSRWSSYAAGQSQGPRG
jgi:hypothetical protein